MRRGEGEKALGRGGGHWERGCKRGTGGGHWVEGVGTR